MNSRECDQFAQAKPAGGYAFIKCVEVLAVWGYLQKETLRFADVRVWFALRELVARRCTVEGEGTREYCVEEIERLTGCKKSVVRASLVRLEEARLIHARKSRIVFAPRTAFQSVPEQPEVQRLIALTTNVRRKIPVPRRVLRLLAGERRKAMSATLLGHLIRLVYYRDGTCRPIGACKSSWVAEVFGIDARSVKRCRSELIVRGLLAPLDADQWYRNRYGWRGMLNLNWSDKRMSPRRVAKRPRLSPPVSNRELSTRERNQEPSAGSSGLWKKDSSSRRHTLGLIRASDLTSKAAMSKLFARAAKAGHVDYGEAGLLKVLTAAEHALRIGTRNPSGLFVWLVTRGNWHYLSQADEDAARRRCLQTVGQTRREASLTGPEKVSDLIDTLLFKKEHVP